MSVSKPPKIEDVAKLAGVSTATVSRCLNEPQRLRPETREKVESAIHTLGYTPNFGGRALASNRTGTIGAVIPTMDNAIFAQAMQSLEEVLAENQMTLFISTSQYQSDREIEKIRSLLSRGVDGLVLIGSEGREAIDPLLTSRGLPCINLWTAKPFPGRVTIGFNNEETSRKLARTVYDHGHRNVAMIAGVTEGNGRAAGRLRGVIKEMDALGVPIRESWVQEAKYSFHHGQAAVAELLKGEDRPSAIICGNDVIAVGAMKAARDAGLDVPKDLSVIGFDDIDLANAVSPALTTVRVPHRRMGHAAGRAMTEWVNTGIQPADITFEPELIMRQTLARI